MVHQYTKQENNMRKVEYNAEQLTTAFRPLLTKLKKKQDEAREKYQAHVSFAIDVLVSYDYRLCWFRKATRGEIKDIVIDIATSWLHRRQHKRAIKIIGEDFVRELADAYYDRKIICNLTYDLENIIDIPPGSVITLYENDIYTLKSAIMKIYGEPEGEALPLVAFINKEKQ